MPRRLRQPSKNGATNNTKQTGAIERHSAEARAVLERAEVLLQAGLPRQALELLARSKVHSPELTNATGVCLLRLGQADRAIELFRNLVLAGGVVLRRDVPTAWKVNFATALLLVDNLDGCTRMLGEIQEEHHPGVQRLRGALKDWSSRMSVWEKIRWFLGRPPDRRVELDFLPGEL